MKKRAVFLVAGLATVWTVSGFSQVLAAQNRIPQSVVINGQTVNAAHVTTPAGQLQSFTCPAPRPAPGSNACKPPAPRPRVASRWALFAGPMDVVANALYRVAAAHGPLAIVAPIGALYPVSTVLLALAVDRERVAPAQIAGLGLAATALVLAAT